MKEKDKVKEMYTPPKPSDFILPNPYDGNLSLGEIEAAVKDMYDNPLKIRHSPPKPPIDASTGLTEMFEELWKTKNTPDRKISLHHSHSGLDMIDKYVREAAGLPALTLEELEKRKGQRREGVYHTSGFSTKFVGYYTDQEDGYVLARHKPMNRWFIDKVSNGFAAQIRELTTEELLQLIDKMEPPNDAVLLAAYNRAKAEEE